MQAMQVKKGALEPEFFPVQDVLEQMGDDNYDKLQKFSLFILCNMRAQPQAIHLTETCFYRLLMEYGGFDVEAICQGKLKDGSILSALWVIFLRYYRETHNVISYKYNDAKGFLILRRFLDEYDGKFDLEPEGEQVKLAHIANWIALMLAGVTHIRNKGFYMLVVPKFLEGFSVKYSIGTGQSKFTTFRSDIFHHESGTKLGKRKQYEYSRYRTTTEDERRIQTSFFAEDQALGFSLSSERGRSCICEEEKDVGNVIFNGSRNTGRLDFDIPKDFLQMSASFELAMDKLADLSSTSFGIQVFEQD